MKGYIITHAGSKAPEKNWDGNIVVYPSKKAAKQSRCYYGSTMVRRVEIKIKEIIE